MFCKCFILHITTVLTVKFFVSRTLQSVVARSALQALKTPRFNDILQYNVSLTLNGVFLSSCNALNRADLKRFLVCSQARLVTVFVVF